MAVGDTIEEGSWTILVGMTKEVSESVAVGRRVRTGVCELVTEGMTGIGIVAESLADVTLAVAETLTEEGADGDTERDSDAEGVAEGATDRDSEADKDTVPEADKDAGADAGADADADGAIEADSVAVAFVVAEAEIVALLRIAPEVLAV